MTIKRLDIVSIPVTDQEKAKTFYTDILGFELVRDNPMGPDQRWVEIAPSGAETSLTLVTWFESMPPGSIQGLVLDTDDVDGMRDTLVERGLKISDVQSEFWGRFCTFFDPDGNGWVLQEAAV